MMKVLIVEDENLAAKRLQQILQQMDEPMEVVAVTRTIADTVSWLKTNTQPEIILLDIELADGQSFEIFNQVEVRSVVIFTTSYDEYALRAFRVNSIDYLLKPVDKDDLQKAINKYRQLCQVTNPLPQQIDKVNIEQLLQDMHKQLNTKTYRKRFLVKNGSKLVSVDVEEVAFFFVEGRLVFLKTINQKKYIVEYTMEELELMLDPLDFFRINRASIVARKCITQIEEYLGSRLFLQIQPILEKEPIVSREKVSLFKQWMGG